MTTAHETAGTAGERRDRRPVWIRGAFMLFFLFAFGIAQGLVALTAVIQFLSLLVSGRRNEFLAGFGRSIGKWLDQVARFQSAETEERPFPWAPWPAGR